jgi:integrase
MQAMLAAGLAESTRAAYTRTWRRFMGDGVGTAGEDFEDQLARFVVRRTSRPGPRVATVRQDVAAIRSIASARAGRASGAAESAGFVDRILRGAEAVERAVRPRVARPDGRIGRQVPPLGEAELIAMKRVASAPDEQLLWRHAAVAYSAGLRAAEHLGGADGSGLTWERVRLDHPDGPHLVLGWTAREGGRTKTQPSAIGTLGEAGRVDGAAILRRMRRDAGAGATGPIFRYGRRAKDVKGGTLSRQLFVRRLRRLAQKAGLQQASRYTAHSLRAGRATDMLRAGVPRDIIMKACRWKTEAALRRYERLRVRELRSLSRTGEPTDEAGVG